MIRLLKNPLGVEPEWGLTKGSEFQVVAAPSAKVADRKGVWVRAANGETVNIFPGEYELVT